MECDHLTRNIVEPIVLTISSLLVAMPSFMRLLSGGVDDSSEKAWESR